MKLLIPSVLLLGILFFCFYCTRDKNNDKRDLIIVGTGQEKGLMESYLPESFRVESLVAPGISGMYEEAQDTLLSKMEGAEAFLYFNTYIFEHNVKEKMHRLFPNVKLISSGNSLPRKMDGFFIGRVQINDPQILQSLRNSRRAVLESSMRMSERFPEREKEIQHLAGVRDDRLQQLDDSLSNLLAPYYGDSFITIHPMLGYFANDYGLRRIYLKPEGKEESEAEFAERMATAISSDPKVVFYNRDDDKELAIKVAENLGIKAIRLQLDSVDYVDRLVEIPSYIINGGNRSQLEK